MKIARTLGERRAKTCMEADYKRKGVCQPGNRVLVRRSRTARLICRARLSA